MLPKLAEWHVYGNEQQGRFLTKYPEELTPTYYGTEVTDDIKDNKFKRQLGKKSYELKDHLGNVRVTHSDIKMPTGTPAQPFRVDLLSKSEYYPYGMKINDLSYNATGTGTRYSYNGTHEQDKELNADGNYLDFGNFGYDTRVAMRRNQEPLRAEYTKFSSYAAYGNNPIFYKDADGNALETAWDALNVSMGITSFGVNMAQGNYLDAAVDALGVGVDIAATAVPVAPGGAATVIKIYRNTKIVNNVLPKTIEYTGKVFKVGSKIFYKQARAELFLKTVNHFGSEKIAIALWESGTNLFKQKSGTNKLAIELGTNGTSDVAHHIIPVELLKNNDIVKNAVEQGFDFNGLINGFKAPKSRHTGSHPDYTTKVENLIIDTRKQFQNLSDKEVVEKVANKMKEVLGQSDKPIK